MTTGNHIPEQGFETNAYRRALAWWAAPAECPRCGMKGPCMWSRCEHPLAGKTNGTPAEQKGAE